MKITAKKREVVTGLILELTNDETAAISVALGRLCTEHLGGKRDAWPFIFDLKAQLEEARKSPGIIA